MNKLNEELRTQAIKNGLCAAWRHSWESDKTQQELIDMYVKGIDFSLLHDWPSVNFIKANFDRELLNRNLLFVDEDIDLDNAPSGVYVLNGECSGIIRLAPWAVATLYLRHNTNIRIIAGDFARVFVRLYDNADATVNAGESTVVKVYDRRR